MVLSLHLPWWRAERIRRRHGPPRPDAVLLVREERGQRVVSSCCGVAGGVGVVRGLTLAHARALLVGKRTHSEDEDAHADAKRLKALAQWAGRRWSPIVGVDGADGLLMDIAGCEHLFGGVRGLCADLRQRVRSLGLTPRLGVARTVGAAWAVARYAPGAIVAPGREREALSPLPVSALRIDDDATDALAEVGIERIGQLLDLPRRSLPLRYGEDVLLRIDQALGDAFEKPDRTEQSDAIFASRELPGGTTRLDAVEGVVRGLLDQLCDALLRRESGLRRLDCVFDRLGSEAESRSVQVSRACRDPRHLWGLLRPMIERLNMGFGVERVALWARGVSRLRHTQDTLDGEATHRDDASLAALTDALAARLGRERVLRAELVPSHRPERAFRWSPFDAGNAGTGDARPLGPRPSRLFDPPVPAKGMALFPDGPLMRLGWRGVEAGVLACVGPERIGPEWWREREPTRDYFRVQDESGRWLWVFRESHEHGPAWFVHGEWS